MKGGVIMASRWNGDYYDPYTAEEIDSQRNEILAMQEQGMNRSQIAKALGVTPPTVTNRLLRAQYMDENNGVPVFGWERIESAKKNEAAKARQAQRAEEASKPEQSAEALVAQLQAQNRERIGVAIRKEASRLRSLGGLSEGRPATYAPRLPSGIEGLGEFYDVLRFSNDLWEHFDSQPAMIIERS